MGARPPSELPFSTRPEADFLRPGLWWPFAEGDVTVVVVKDDLLFLCMLSSSMSSERLSERRRQIGTLLLI